MAHDHSHGHEHSHGGHSEGHSHAGHSHGGPNPFDRECQAPTTAAVYCFVTAFLGALSAISLPTHITGYFLPQIPQTALLWSTVTSGGVYSVLCVVAFFNVLEESTSERYRAPVLAEEEGEDWEDETEVAETKRKMGTLRWISRAAAVAVVLEAGMSIALFALGLRFSAEEWNKWCKNDAVIVVSEPSESGNSTSAHDAAVLDVCEEMHLHQTYLVLAIPGLLLLLELVRFLKTHQFVDLALDRPTTSPFKPLPAVDSGEAFDASGADASIRDVRELAKRRRRRTAERMRRRYAQGASDGEDEKKLLSA